MRARCLTGPTSRVEDGAALEAEGNTYPVGGDLLAGDGVVDSHFGGEYAGQGSVGEFVLKDKVSGQSDV